MTLAPRQEKVDRLSWTNFHDTYLVANAPSRISMLDRPPAEIDFDPASGKIVLRAAAEREEPVPTDLPRIVTARFVLLRGKRYLEVITEHPGLYRPFYFLLLSIIDHLAAGRSPAQSLRAALTENRELLQQETSLSEEALLGLFGELWVLRELVQLHGPVAIGMWTGPGKLPHDFRFGNYELEVKTSRSVDRVHRIHGLGQLTPSADASLFIVSILAEPTGPASGATVPELVSAIGSMVSQSVEHATQFRKCLAGCGYLDSDAEKYPLRLVLRDIPIFVPVDAAFPAITADKIGSMFGKSAAFRMSRFEYSVNVQGLGTRIDDPEVRKILQHGR